MAAVSASKSPDGLRCNTKCPLNMTAPTPAKAVSEPIIRSEDA
jgi:hypothetical protein